MTLLFQRGRGPEVRPLQRLADGKVYLVGHAGAAKLAKPLKARQEDGANPHLTGWLVTILFFWCGHEKHISTGLDGEHSGNHSCGTRLFHGSCWLS